MNVENIVQVSSYLSAQQTAASVQIEVVKLANDQIEAEGQAALQMIQALPQGSDNIGSNIDITV